MSVYDAFQEFKPCRVYNTYYSQISRANPYNIRASTHVRPVKCRTEARRMSFLAYGISLINDVLKTKPNCLTENTRLQFKRIVCKQVTVNSVYMFQLTRTVAIDVFRLRSGNDNLCCELNRCMLCDSPMCQNCEESYETVEHYFIDCKFYNDLREDIINHIPFEAWNIDTIPCGSGRYGETLNKTIQDQVHLFVRRTGRFT